MTPKLLLLLPLAARWLMMMMNLDAFKKFCALSIRFDNLFRNYFSQLMRNFNGNYAATHTLCCSVVWVVGNHWLAIGWWLIFRCVDLYISMSEKIQTARYCMYYMLIHLVLGLLSETVAVAAALCRKHIIMFNLSNQICKTFSLTLTALIWLWLSTEQEYPESFSQQNKRYFYI